MTSDKKRKMLLHTCCAPCAIGIIEQLKKEYDLTLYFYNPNIYPKDEYEKRLEEVRKISEKFGVDLVEGKYDCDEWMKVIKGHEEDKEGGERCGICFYFRLEKTAEFARDEGFDVFTTTLSVSPHKNSKIINLTGEELGEKHGVVFLREDFKKDYEKSVELSKRYGLYRQNYCGCLFSLNNSIASPKL